jgi:hypothetical protein
VRLLAGSGAVDALGNGKANVALAFAVLQIHEARRRGCVGIGQRRLSGS